MVDKKLEENIRKAEDLIEIWDKFHRIFERAVSKGQVGSDGEEEFVSVRNLVSSRYEDLMDSMGVKPLRRFIVGSHVYNILSLDKLSIMSDEKQKAVEDDWRLSGEFLGSLRDRLKRKKKRIEGFNRFWLLAKRKIQNK